MARPRQSKETPISLLTKELSQTIKTLAHVRRSVLDQLNIIEGQTKDANISIAQRLDIATKLMEIGTSLGNNTDKLAKFLMDKRVRSLDEESSPATSENQSTIKDIRNLLK